MLDDVTQGDSLRVVDKCGEVVWQRNRPKESSSLLRAKSVFDKKAQDVKVSWQHKTEEGANKNVWLRWSNDAGKHWHALTVGLKGNSVNLEPRNLPSGKVMFQVLAHDGFSTIVGTTDLIQLDPQPPQVIILYPKRSSRVYAEKQIHLWGVASLFEVAEIPWDAYIWYLNDEQVAKGQDTWIDNPGSGKHQIRLEVLLNGLTGSASEDLEIG
jgi:hypothetical protein